MFSTHQKECSSFDGRGEGTFDITLPSSTSSSSSLSVYYCSLPNSLSVSTQLTVLSAPVSFIPFFIISIIAVIVIHFPCGFSAYFGSLCCLSACLPACPAFENLFYCLLHPSLPSASRSLPCHARSSILFHFYIRSNVQPEPSSSSSSSSALRPTAQTNQTQQPLEPFEPLTQGTENASTTHHDERTSIPFPSHNLIDPLLHHRAIHTITTWTTVLWLGGGSSVSESSSLS